MSGEASEVATTTIDRESPSSPRSLSINSRTSRPRSPMRAITLTSASVFRDIIPKSTDFPTPDPAMIPTLWPRPIVNRPSRERIPSVMGFLDNTPSYGIRWLLIEPSFFKFP